MKTSKKIGAYRYLPTDKVRDYCIRHNLYGCGSNLDYSNMLEMCKDKKDTYRIGKYYQSQ